MRISTSLSTNLINPLGSVVVDSSKDRFASSNTYLAMYSGVWVELSPSLTIISTNFCSGLA